MIARTAKPKPASQDRPRRVVSSRPEATKDSRGQLQRLFQGHRRCLYLTYGLLNLENLIRLAQPLALGLAINSLLAKSWWGVWIFIGQHLSHLLVGTLRQLYDTRFFTRLYSEVAEGVVVQQRRAEVDTSRVAARSALSREYIEFFERTVPSMLRAGWAVFGALAMLTFYDPRVLPVCLGLIVPAWFLNRTYSRKTFALSRQLHDELEREVEVIRQSQADAIAAHYQRVANCRVKISDAEAWNFAAMEFFVLGGLVGALAVLTGGHWQAGDVFALFRYLLMFLMGLDAVPRIVQQFSRVRDVQRRTHAEQSVQAVVEVPDIKNSTKTETITS